VEQKGVRTKIKNPELANPIGEHDVIRKYVWITARGYPVKGVTESGWLRWKIKVEDHNPPRHDAESNKSKESKKKCGLRIYSG